MPIHLNPGQDQAVRAILRVPSTGGYTLLGEGGTGKTTCIMQAVRQWQDEGKRVLLTAPTNKAVKQLEKSARAYGVQADAITVHKALGLAMLPTSERKHTARVRQSVLPQYHVMVMDEGSMVSRYALTDYILPAVEEAGVALIVMGDPMQLPPVKETDSRALKVYPGSTLTQVERFSQESAIAELTRDLRQAIQAKKPFQFDADKYQMEVVKPAQFLDRVVQEFSLDTDLENTRVLAWSNHRVDQINQAIRKHLYGKPAVYEVGERIVMGAPIYDPTTKEMMLGTDEECTVKQVQEASLMDEATGKEYKTWMLTLQPVHAGAYTLHCHTIHADSALDLKEDLAAIKKRVLESGDRRGWKEYHELSDLFADVRYCYCITVHRSQGSTYETVMVDVANILRNPRREERNRLLYVAFSRASQKLITSKERFVS